MSDRRLHKGDAVEFDFTLESPIAGRRGERRLGTGVIADDEVNYQTWPPGYSVRVKTSEDYRPGTIIAVTSHNLRRLTQDLSDAGTVTKRRAHSSIAATKKPSWQFAVEVEPRGQLNRFRLLETYSQYEDAKRRARAASDQVWWRAVRVRKFVPDEYDVPGSGFYWFRDGEHVEENPKLLP